MCLLSLQDLMTQYSYRYTTYRVAPNPCESLQLLYNQVTITQLTKERCIEIFVLLWNSHMNMYYIRMTVWGYILGAIIIPRPLYSPGQDHLSIKLSYDYVSCYIIWLRIVCNSGYVPGLISSSLAQMVERSIWLRLLRK